VNFLADKVAIVTGASSGIGFETARIFANEGARVIIGARRKDKLDVLKDKINNDGGQVMVLAGDVKDEAYAQSLVDLAINKFGGLDIAFNNAGTLGAMGNIPDIGLEGWHDTLDTNLTSAFLGAKYQIPAMLKHGTGSIIFTSTFVGHTSGMPGMSPYSASKAGLIGLTRSLATEYGSKGIRINALLPGGVDTPMGRIVANSPDTLAFVEGLHAMKRLAKPEEIAKTALFLASEMSSFVTGSAMLVDGGVSINKT